MFTPFCDKQRLQPLKVQTHREVQIEQNLILLDFLYCRQCRHISKAAKELYISQPAISKSIQKLEDGLECKLFSRSSRGVVLTDEGRLLYDHVSEAFEALNEGEEKLKRSIELGVGQLKIGVSSTLCKYMLLPYLKEFIHRNPHISISIECQSTNETLKLLDDDKIDIGLIGKPASLKTFNFYYLDNIEDIFVTTKDYLRNLSARGVKKSEILQNSLSCFSIKAI